VKERQLRRGDPRHPAGSVTTQDFFAPGKGPAGTEIQLAAISSVYETLRLRGTSSHATFAPPDTLVIKDFNFGTCSSPA
jgi:hypothetical protein